MCQVINNKINFLKKIFRISTVPISLNILLKGQLRFLNQFYNVTAISGSGQDLINVSKREGVQTQIIEMQRNISPLKDIFALYKLYLFFKSEKPLIVHSITPKAGLLSMTAAYFAGVPIRMHTFTGLIFPSRTGLVKKVLIQMDKLLCYYATHIYPEGNGVKNDLQEYKITSKPLKVLVNGNVNGIDTKYFSRNHISAEVQNQLRSTLGLLPNDFVFIFVGRLVSDKGINELVEALKNLNLNFSLDLNPKLLLVGPLETELDALLPETLLEIENNSSIISAGYQDDVRPYFAIADALAFPSYREGFPNVVLQAGAMELPSIVSNINGCNEIIENEQNGLIIPPKNTEQLQDAMMKLVTDKELYDHLKKNARSRIVQNYEQAVVWQAILEEYRKAEYHV